MLDNIFVKLYNDILFVFNAIKLKKTRIVQIVPGGKAYLFMLAIKNWVKEVYDDFLFLIFLKHLETTRNEQNERSDCIGPQTIKCD